MKKTKSPEKANILANAFQSLVQNVFTSRAAWLQRLLDPRRDIDFECGHPLTVSVEEYKRLFLRGDIAGKIVSLLPDESWAERPEIIEGEDEKESEFEKAWIKLEKEFSLINMMHRADILSGIGRYGVILLGTDDGLKLNEPLEGATKLLYVRAFDEALATVISLESDVTNPRYGLPKEYLVHFSDNDLLSISGVSSDASVKSNTVAMSIHWSRIIHLCDNRLSSDVFGAPRMEKVLNRLLDVRKIAGGSGEMFWKGGFPGLSIEAAPGLEERVTFDEEATKEQLDNYMNGLQRYIAMVGMQTKSLAPQIADPGPHIDIQLRLIATAMGVPWRVLIGSEAAQLASEQDTRAWNRRLHRRRTEYLTPFVILPLIQRLIELKILPEPKEIIVNWPDLNTSSDLDKASVAEKRTNALAKYAQSGADTLMTPFHYFTRILGMGDNETRSIIEETEKLVDDTEPEEDDENNVGEEAERVVSPQRNGGAE